MKVLYPEMCQFENTYSLQVFWLSVCLLYNGLTDIDEYVVMVNYHICYNCYNFKFKFFFIIPFSNTVCQHVELR